MFLHFVIFATILLGDANCSGQETIVDANLIAQYDAGIWSGEQANCPNVGEWVLVWDRHPHLMKWGDWNRDGKVDIVDALTTAQRVDGMLPPLAKVRVLQFPQP